MSLSTPRLKYVTIATDISCDNKYRICTWACYIRYNGGVIKKVGLFKDYPKSTGWAETFALTNALFIASEAIDDWDESRIIIHNEVEYVLRPLLTKKGNIRKIDQERAEAVLSMSLPILDMAQSWELRKIQAHYKHWKTSDNPAKYAINRWCDFEARKLLQATRNKIKKTGQQLQKGV